MKLNDLNGNKPVRLRLSKLNQSSDTLTEKQQEWRSKRMSKWTKMPFGYMSFLQVLIIFQGHSWIALWQERAGNELIGTGEKQQAAECINRNRF